MLTKVPSRCVNFDLPNMGVTAILVIREHCDLYEVSPQCAFSPVIGCAHSRREYGDPPAGLTEFLNVDLLEIMKRRFTIEFQLFFL